MGDLLAAERRALRCAHAFGRVVPGVGRGDTNAPTGERDPILLGGGQASGEVVVVAEGVRDTGSRTVLDVQAPCGVVGEGRRGRSAAGREVDAGLGLAVGVVREVGDDRGDRGWCGDLSLPVEPIVGKGRRIERAGLQLGLPSEDIPGRHRGNTTDLPRRRPRRDLVVVGCPRSQPV